MEELELAEQCKQGDNGARKLLYQEYAGRLLALCRRYVQNNTTAEDLLHDGFIHIFEVMDKFTWRGNGSLSAWLQKVMLNVILQHLRQHDLLRNSTDISTIEEEYAAPTEAEVESLPSETLAKLIAELPPGYRTVFNLYIVEDKSHREIAEILGINEKSSSSQLFHAKKLLAKRIKEYIA